MGKFSNIDILIIQVNGSPVAPKYVDALTEMVVEQSLYLPDMFMLRFADPRLELVDESEFNLGATVKLAIQKRGDNKSVPLMEGEVTALEPIFLPNGGTVFTVRGYSKIHRLHFGRKTRTFLKQKDSEIAAKIAQENGLKVLVDDSDVRHDYVVQWNQTDMEFLASRANRIGYDLYLEKGALCFKKADNERQAGPTLKFEELQSFRVNVSARGQVGKAIAAGWDVKTKKAIVAQSSRTTQDLTASESSLRSKANKFGVNSAQEYAVNGDIALQTDANRISSAMLDDHAREFVEAEGACIGDAAIKAGVTIEIKNLGLRFSGKYFVTAATHVYSEAGYSTSFSVSGRRPYTIHHLLGNGVSEDGHVRIDGVVPAIVTNNKDPDDLGRVKVTFPWLTSEHESNWARVVMPMAGPQRGILFIPEINDEVLVAFEHGNPHSPYVVGAMWNGKDRVPIPISKYLQGSKVVQRIIRTTAGHEILLDDTQGAEKITIIDKSKNDKVIFDAVKGEITIEAGGNMTLKAGGNISISAQGNISIEAKGKMEAKANAGCSVETPATLTLKGTGQFSVESSGSGMVKGSMLQVQASGPNTIKGNPVMIN